jgi:hypothetical protein
MRINSWRTVANYSSIFHWNYTQFSLSCFYCYCNETTFFPPTERSKGKKKFVGNVKTTREPHILCPRKVQTCCILNSAKPAVEDVGFYFENPEILVISSCLYPIRCCTVLSWCVLLLTNTPCKIIKLSIRKKSLMEPATDPLPKYSPLRTCVCVCLCVILFSEAISIEVQ